MQTVDIWQMIEEAPKHVSATADLYHWSTNYDPGKGPFTLFLDLIGWSDEWIGEPLYSLNNVAQGLGYVELDKLGLALREYAESPHAVHEFVDQLMQAES